jgi:ribitol-5-phosphate 2-dehydrogenase
LPIGARVVVVPNVPCYVAFPERYPSRRDGCDACRPGGAGENYCRHHLFLSSNVDGLAQTLFEHPASLVVPVPPDVPDTIAALVEPLSTIAAGCEKALVRPAARHLILGNGPLGQLVAIVLAGVYGVPRDAIVMSGHDWEARADARELAGTVLDAADDDGFAALNGAVDVAYECVGGDANGETLAQAIATLRPGGTVVLFGPSERGVLVDTREVIAKGLVFVGCNRSWLPHFVAALNAARDAEMQQLLARVVADEVHDVRSADDLNRALYQAWTNREARKTLMRWAGPE